MDLSQAKKYANKIMKNQWVKWVHPGFTPAETSFEKKQYAENELLNMFHCARCLNMNGCCFVIDNCPRNPLHNNCHCYYIKATSVTVTATSSIG